MAASAKTACHSNEKLDARALATLFRAIESDRGVATLRLCNAGLTPNLVVQLADFLEQNTTLTHVDLSGNAIDAHGASCLAASLANNNAVTSLSLAKCGLQRDSLAPWVPFFQGAATKHTSKLTDLCLASNKLDDTSVDQLVAVIQAAQTPHMRFDLRKNRLGGRDIRRLADALQTNSAIVRLQLDGNQDNSNNNNDDDDAETGDGATLKQLKKIEFCLRRNARRLQRSETLRQIQEIKHSSLQVQACCFDNVDLSIADAELLGRALRVSCSVVTLRLASNALPAEGAKRIFHGLQANASVRSLAVVDNNIGDVGMRALAALLRSQATAASPPLQSVHVSNSIHLTTANGLLQPIARRTASLLHHAFASYAAIQSLSLANCALSDCDIGVVVSGIAWSARIQSLDLRNNGFGDATAHVFSHMLRRCQLFSRLDLSGNRFTLAGILPIAQAASAHPSIRTLLFGHIRAHNATGNTAGAATASSGDTDTAALIATMCKTLQQSFSLAQVELRVTTTTRGGSAPDAAKQTVSALNAVLLERSGAKRTHERDVLAQDDALHAHRCRFRAFVRQTAVRAVGRYFRAQLPTHEGSTCA